jgi:predicted unusual protein kinase regulating ubiquinone biosynthesis (AarF/ABC1/UbiB family)
VFARFGPAIAAASLAQVHEAELVDGTPVAVKVLVPGIESIVEADLHALRVLAAAGADALPGVDVATTVAELTRAVRAELDCRAEAASLAEFRARFAADPRVLAPRPHLDLCTTRVLVMERIDGARLVDYLAAAAPADRERVIATLVDCFAEQILEHGVFHADPHPGNFLVVDGPRVALLDFGCVRRLPAGVARAYARLVVAVLSADATRAAALFAELGFSGDAGALQRLAELLLAALRDASQLDPRRQLTEALAILQAHPVARVPEHFVLVGRVLATLAGMVFTYPPAGGLLPILAPRLARASASGDG